MHSKASPPRASCGAKKFFSRLPCWKPSCRQSWRKVWPHCARPASPCCTQGPSSSPSFQKPSWTPCLPSRPKLSVLYFLFFFHFQSPESSSPGPSPKPWAPRRTLWAEPPSRWTPGCPSKRPCWQSRRCRGTGSPWRGPWCLQPRVRGAGTRQNALAGREGHSESRGFWKWHLMMVHNLGNFGNLQNENVIVSITTNWYVLVAYNITNCMFELSEFGRRWHFTLKSAHLLANQCKVCAGAPKHHLKANQWNEICVKCEEEVK